MKSVTRLKTEYEDYWLTIYQGILMLIGINYLLPKAFKSRSYAKEALFIINCIIIVIIILVFIYHYFESNNRKKALKYGVACNAYIKGIYKQKSSNIGNVPITSGYWIMLSCQGKDIKIGRYITNPSDFLPENKKCKVYYYRSKYYIEELYKREKISSEEAVRKYSAVYMLTNDECDREAMAARYTVAKKGTRIFCLNKQLLHLNQGHYKVYIDIHLGKNDVEIGSLKYYLDELLGRTVKDINYNQAELSIKEMEDGLKNNILKWIKDFDSRLIVKDVLIASKEYEVLQYNEQIRNDEW